MWLLVGLLVGQLLPSVYILWNDLPTNSPTNYPTNNRISWIWMRIIIFQVPTRKSLFYGKYNRLWLLHKIALETRLIQGLLIIQSKISSRDLKGGICNPLPAYIFKYLNPIGGFQPFYYFLAPPIFQTLHRHCTVNIYRILIGIV